jgi:hypothetical protein
MKEKSPKNKKFRKIIAFIKKIIYIYSVMSRFTEIDCPMNQTRIPVLKPGIRCGVFSKQAINKNSRNYQLLPPPPKFLTFSKHVYCLLSEMPLSEPQMTQIGLMEQPIFFASIFNTQHRQTRISSNHGNHSNHLEICGSDIFQRRTP